MNSPLGRFRSPAPIPEFPGRDRPKEVADEWQLLRMFEELRNDESGRLADEMIAAGRDPF